MYVKRVSASNTSKPRWSTYCCCCRDRYFAIAQSRTHSQAIVVVVNIVTVRIVAIRTSRKTVIGCGHRTWRAWSMILQIFCACVSERLPPMTVKSWLNTNTVRPLISPRPVTCEHETNRGTEKMCRKRKSEVHPSVLVVSAVHEERSKKQFKSQNL